MGNLDGQILLDIDGRPHTGKGSIFFYRGARTYAEAAEAHDAWMRVQKLRNSPVMYGRRGVAVFRAPDDPELVEAQREYDEIRRRLSGKDHDERA